MSKLSTPGASTTTRSGRTALLARSRLLCLPGGRGSGWLRQPPPRLFPHPPEGGLLSADESGNSHFPWHQHGEQVKGANTYVENLSVSAAFSAGSLMLLGGWDSTFTNRIFLPPDTIIHGNQAGRVLDLYRAAGSVVIDGFTLTNGLSDAGG